MIPSNLCDLVTFVPNKQEPVHNWLYYKEGYAKGLVEWAVKEFGLQEPVCDPFCGVGTTLLACKQMGLQSTGFDVSPLAVLASEAKTRNYDLGAIEKTLAEFGAMHPRPIGKFPNPKIRRLFREQQMDDIYFYYKKILEITDPKVRNLFLLALVDTTGRVANVVKIGGSLRRQKKPPLPVKKLFLGKVKKMLLDLRHAKMPAVEPAIFTADARITNLQENSVGSVITSPPYLNKIEYTKVYKLELGLFFNSQETRLRAYIADEAAVPDSAGAENGGGMRAHIADGATGRDSETRMPLIAKAYFDDMRKALRNMLHYLRPGGKAVIVAGGGCFPYETVESDDILIKIAEEEGFRCAQKIVARCIQCMRNRTIKVGTVRESVIVLEKPAQ
ncbi:MAG: hypothetical protein NTW59_00150 [Candidatus Diapherotrites archaeon]|nr:hypothetical protein [Candidatus Diapherotrites archaeon]